ncbi:hypothetical protein F2P81_008680 [Scophthalmus maximus]|uniref:Uncharacterized protein n=1 Tax=Scophthalmus maximus TaxID=52904 RepID=A0A6A4SSM6_SCOMX|nr:hypothetical protein F2P81_008680 [Scophthalmus maximus]
MNSSGRLRSTDAEQLSPGRSILSLHSGPYENFNKNLTASKSCTLAKFPLRLLLNESVSSSSSPPPQLRRHLVHLILEWAELVQGARQDGEVFEQLRAQMSASD